MSISKCSSKETQLKVVLEELVQSANKACQFSQRDTALNAERFVQTLVLGWLREADASLNSLAQFAQDLGIRVTGAALHERMGGTAVALLGWVLMAALRQRVQSRRLPVEAFGVFSAIHVTDSTQVSLPPSLLGDYAASDKAARLKLQVTLDYLTGQWVGAEVVTATVHDQNSELPCQQAIAGSLNLFDLGYFKQDRLQDMVAQEAYFVCRCQSQTALYVPDTDQQVDIHQWLHALTVDEAERWVDLGSRARLPVRLVVRRLPQSVADARRRKAKDRYHRDGKICSKTYLSWLGWDILITNLATDDWSLTRVFDLYPIRMQIEWLFRIWKSHLRIHHFGNWRRERVLCQWYAHLIGALCCHRLSAGWHWRRGYEFSLVKCVQIIQHRIQALMACLARNWRGICSWKLQLEGAFRQFGRKSKRKKTPSTCQIFMNWALS
jgi:hypothetical protein